MIIKDNTRYPLFSLEGKYLEDIEVNFNFTEKTFKYLVHRALIKQSTYSRHGKASSKTRSEVRGGGRKPWRQKGTGKARAGSIRSPLWRGGGVIFGPKPKSYSIKLNRKESRLALKTVIYNSRFKTILTIDLTKEIIFPKTKYIKNMLCNLGVKPYQKVLIIVHKEMNSLILSCRNLPNVSLISSSQINIKAVLNAKHIIMTKEALKNIQEVCNE